MSDRVTTSTLYTSPVVLVLTPGVALALSPTQYDQAVMRGKLWLREQANETRLTKAAAADEAKQLQWLDHA